MTDRATALATWEEASTKDEQAYERRRKMLLEDPEWLDWWGGCFWASWSCAELDGLHIVQLQSNPERPLSEAAWVYVVRHSVDFPDFFEVDDVATADSLDGAKAAAERYLASPLAFALGQAPYTKVRA